MNGWTIVFDLAIVCFAVASAWLWWASSRHRVRRISRCEPLDAADINRIVVAVNRSQMLNARAALTTACARTIAALRLVLEMSGAEG